MVRVESKKYHGRPSSARLDSFPLGQPRAQIIITYALSIMAIMIHNYIPADMPNVRNRTLKLEVIEATARLSPAPVQPIIRVGLCPNLSVNIPASGPVAKKSEKFMTNGRVIKVPESSLKYQT